MSCSIPVLRTKSFLAAALILCTLLIAGVRAQTAVQIVALGASNTEGWGLAPEHAYPVRLQALLASKGIDAKVANAGVILQPGTNDERMGLAAERAANIEKIRARLEARGTKLLVIENSLLDALPRSQLRDDGIHFTPAGYALLAERLLPEVLAALGR